MGVRPLANTAIVSHRECARDHGHPSVGRRKHKPYNMYVGI